MQPKAINNIIKTKKLFGDVPVNYSLLVDLNTERIYDHFMLVNETDQSIIIKFTNSAITSEIIIGSGAALTLDDFKHNGIINYKYESVAPLEGSIKHFTW